MYLAEREIDVMNNISVTLEKPSRMIGAKDFLNSFT